MAAQANKGLPVWLENWTEFSASISNPNTCKTEKERVGESQGPGGRQEAPPRWAQSARFGAMLSGEGPRPEACREPPARKAEPLEICQATMPAGARREAPICLDADRGL